MVEPKTRAEMQPPKLAEFMIFARGALAVGAFAGESRMRATTGHIRSSVQGIVSRKVRAWCELVITSGVAQLPLSARSSSAERLLRG
ncbi:MAG: hypothetical protein H6872_06305 [Methylobacteriaceae bacterium]|nr:hypothetical protein [Methylobacteriaceae bacterium]